MNSTIIVANFADDFGNYVSPYTLDNFIARYNFYKDIY